MPLRSEAYYALEKRAHCALNDNPGRARNGRGPAAGRGRRGWRVGSSGTRRGAEGIQARSTATRASRRFRYTVALRTDTTPLKYAGFRLFRAGDADQDIGGTAFGQGLKRLNIGSVAP